MRCPIRYASIYGGRCLTYVKFLLFPSMYQLRKLLPESPVREMWLPRYGKLSTYSSVCCPTVTGGLCSKATDIVFVFSQLMHRPNLAAWSCNFVVMSCKLSCESPSKAMSSTKSKSVSLSCFHLMSYTGLVIVFFMVKSMMRRNKNRESTQPVVFPRIPVSLWKVPLWNFCSREEMLHWLQVPRSEVSGMGSYDLQKWQRITCKTHW